MNAQTIPTAVWIAAAAIIGLIVLALIGYGTGMWEDQPSVVAPGSPTTTAPK